MAGMTGTISQPGTSRGRPLRVLLVDDDPLVRAGLRTILSSASDLDVVSEAADGSAAITAVRAHRVDVALMDVRMPGMDGITATKQITALPDPPKVIVLTTFHLDEYVFGALRAGASGFLLKDTPPAEHRRRGAACRRRRCHAVTIGHPHADRPLQRRHH